MRFGRFLALAFVITAPLVGAAVDAPHEDGLYCSNCHLGHNALGASLTKAEENSSICDSCHALPEHTGKFGFPWGTGDQAVVGESGISHRWDAPATNLGATPPIGTPMADKTRLADNKLQCSTCHDQHAGDTLMGSPADPAHVGTQHTSYPVDLPQAPNAGGTGRTLTLLSPVGVTAAAKGYLIQIVQAGSGTTATFMLSNDNGTSWFGCIPATYSYVAFNANPCTAGASVPLNDGTNVTVAFTGGAGTFLAGDRWSFYVSYPYLRVSNKDGAMCTTCHKDRNMTWQNAEGTGAIVGTGDSVLLGTTVFSHPVGQKLNDTGRTNGLTAVLDANGAVQAAGDGNATNDLTFGTNGIVTCMSCHHPHNADSNSLSLDPR